MVNLGPSGRCHTCRERRVKCDEAKPECHRCIKADRNCGGYEKLPRPFKIQDQTYKFCRASPRPADTGSGKAGTPDRGRPSISPLSSTVPFGPENDAVSFFLGDCLGGRSFDSSHGLFEVIMPLLNSEPKDSALSTAVASVASKYFVLWTEGPKAFLLPDKSLNHSLARLRAAIQDPAQRSQPSTILAALILHWYENVSSVFGGRKVLRHHYNGALSLLPVAEYMPEQTTAGSWTGYMARYLIHLEVSLALREGRPLSERTLAQAKARHATVMPNPSSILDDLGADIADLRFRFIRMSKLKAQSVSHTSRTIWFNDALKTHLGLLAWAECAPADWLPLRLRSDLDFDPSISSYMKMCDVYPSCQIASVWNLWRWYRLLLLHMLLALQQGVSISRYESEPAAIMSVADCQDAMQQTIDDICFSLPYFLGNRTRPSSIADFTNQAIEFPSHHSLPPGSPRRRRIETEHTLSKDEHERHVIAQGSWHSMGPLCRLLNLFAGEHGWVVTDALRIGQQDWICEQFLRVTTILRLPIEDFVDIEEVAALDFGDARISAGYIALKLHEGLNIIGGT
ncbi:uncharacterized protein E0L32_006944 [Thyridium curvatum]|uniref:Zn(2)-C6 fungal-type domain-containing protein n=1 Tax=Thyridium curvatum TaxID=1093900 RepID=A0A507AXS0_9PEZI|nr:uncharacterized protein E0L32_006944 [Thyridium curvatum]TPX12297.1 hypothetical protein E0L32_006944 [Thyridium curvatum]